VAAGRDIRIALRSIDPLRDVLDVAAFARLEAALGRTRDLLGTRRIVNVSSTATGGGVAELLSTLLPYALGAGIGVRWMVIAGDPAFFAITKRLHNRLHGEPGDGGPLGPAERAAYERVLAANADDLRARISPGDVVMLHDPQTAGLIPVARSAGAVVVWRSHVGCDTTNVATDEAWLFLDPYLRDADACVFSRASYVPSSLRVPHVAVIRPSIDPLSPKNAAMSADAVAEVIARHSDVLGAGAAAIAGGERVVTQISRWDRLKDPTGVLDAFADQVLRYTEAHLILAGPAVDAVADDPEAASVLQEVTARRAARPGDVRARISLCCLPMDDLDENARIVNALQRASTVVVQKSLREGFGLTVAEAMWKGRPVVASAVGGIVDQIEHRRSGVLVPDPANLWHFGDVLADLLSDDEERARIGLAARERARSELLHDRHIAELVALLEDLVG
jgi:trehalose synthase